MSRNSRGLTLFSKRERVGCDASAGPARGSRSRRSLWMASLDHAPRVVAVGVAAGDTKDALAEQLEALVLDFAGLPKIDEAARQALGQLELGIEPFEQDRSAVRAGIGHVERGDNGLAFRLESERDLRYTRCSHRASSFACLEASRHRFYSTGEPCADA